MIFNPSKTESLVVSLKRTPGHPAIYFQGSPITEVEIHKHLGLSLSRDLSWNHHVNQICISAGRRLNIMRKLSFKVSRWALEQMYMHYVRPIFDYCSFIYDNCTVTNKMRLERQQLYAARICSGGLISTSSSTLLSEMGWTRLEDRRKTRKLVMFFKIIRGLVPPYLSNLSPQKTASAMHYNLRHAANFRIYKCRTTKYQTSFLPCTTKLWNTLALHDHISSSLPKFKLYITKLFSSPKQPHYYRTGQRLPNILHTRLRMNCSKLNAHLFKNNIRGDSCCQCNHEKEDIAHYFLHCPLYFTQRTKLLRSICVILAPNVHRDLLPAIAPTHFLNILLKGSPDVETDVNSNIFHYVQTYIIETGRFIA